MLSRSTQHRLPFNNGSVMEGLSMKKGLLILIVLVLLGACVKQPVETQEEVDLVKELQEIESKLADDENSSESSDDATGAVVVVVDENAEAAESVAAETVENTDIDTLVADVEEALKNPDVDTSNVDTSTLQKIEFSETELVDLKINADDKDDDPLEFEFSAPLDADGKWKTDYGDAGEYVVTISASDSVNTVDKLILLVVKKKNVAPLVEGVELLLTVNEGMLLSLKPEVTDKNNDDVTLSFSKPLDKDGQWQTDHKSAGTYDITVTATDGEAETVVKSKLTVKDVNVPPEITGLDESVEIDEGETVTFKPVVSDLDGDKVTVTISEPVDDDGVWETTFKDHGTYTVTVAASDGKDTVSKEIVLTVNDVNVPPQIIDIVKR
ncbi:hypothetical protein J4207_03120 [Candidatus Woesearchaeota archaeon]|nr:hypothetical protein [Candidatus Woesearchaeota archaeon]